jgi:ABC-type multidrug transport system ATPase subunit
MSEPAAALLRAEGLTKSFVGRRVVDDVTIEVRAGEIVGLLGPNGAGKTTSFHMIVGLTRPDAGRVQQELKNGFIGERGFFRKWGRLLAELVHHRLVVSSAFVHSPLQNS